MEKKLGQKTQCQLEGDCVHPPLKLGAIKSCKESPLENLLDAQKAQKELLLL